MKVLVLISNVPDTTTKIKFVDGNTAFDTNGVQWIINPWDELALTRAVELKEAGKVEKITVANVGLQLTEATLRKALAVGADDAIRSCLKSLPTSSGRLSGGRITASLSTRRRGVVLGCR